MTNEERAVLVKCERRLRVRAEQRDAEASDPVAERFWFGQSRADEAARYRRLADTVGELARS